MSEKIGLYVWTSDKQMVCLPAWAYLFNKFWDESLNVKVLGYKSIEFDLPKNFEYISLGEQRGPEYWSNDMYDYFKNCDDEFFYLTTEDGFIIKEVNKEIIDVATDLFYCNKDNLMRFNLTANAYHRKHHVIDTYQDLQIINWDINEEYRMSLNHSIWNREIFLSLLEPNETPWQFETSARANDENFLCLGTKDTYALCVGHGYKKGRKITNWYADSQKLYSDLNKEDIDFIEQNNWVPEL